MTYVTAGLTLVPSPPCLKLSIVGPRLILISLSRVYLLKDPDPVGLSASLSVGCPKWTFLIGRTDCDTIPSIPDPILSLRRYTCDSWHSWHSCECAYNYSCTAVIAVAVSLRAIEFSDLTTARRCSYVSCRADGGPPPRRWRQR